MIELKINKIIAEDYVKNSKAALRLYLAGLINEEAYIRIEEKLNTRIFDHIEECLEKESKK